ncbi:MAG: hypothetical protein ABIH71_02975 [Candidatus Omnitrophota bacterium]|nr:hypothetical protein [Candidatus Omnitrophota bacterium]
MLFNIVYRFHVKTVNDGAVAKYPKSVIPAKAGIQNINGINGFWIPAFAGMTENVILQQCHDIPCQTYLHLL